MSALEQMYQQVILDHAKRPHGRGLVEITTDDGAVGESHQVNPTCGDEVTLRVAVAPASAGHGPVVTGVSWDGHGCSISQASASVMTDLVTGVPVEQVTRRSEKFSELMASRGKGLESEEDEDLLGDATAFTGTSKYPARIKCALLGWAALKDSLARSGALAS